jgi:hypothetical protein
MEDMSPGNSGFSPRSVESEVIFHRLVRVGGFFCAKKSPAGAGLEDHKREEL